MKTKVLIWLALLLAALTPELFAEAPCLEFEGTLTYRLVAGTNRPEKIVSKQQFTIITDGRQWRMTLKNAPEFAHGDRRLLTETSYDGSTTRHRMRFPAPPNQPADQDGRPRLFIAELVEIQDGQKHDIASASPIGALWIAYASKDYFQKLKEQRLPDFLSMAPPSHRSPEPSKCEFKLPTETTWKTPATLAYFNEGFTWQKNKEGELEKRKLPPPFDQGYQQSSFHVLSRINVNQELSVPGSMKVDYYSPSTNAVETILTDHVASLEIQTTSAKTVSTPDQFHHAFKEPVSVYDHRVKLSNGKPLNYMSQDGSVHKPGSAKMTEALSQDERRRGKR